MKHGLLDSFPSLRAHIKQKEESAMRCDICEVPP